MNTENVRGTLAIIVVSGFVVAMVVLAIFPWVFEKSSPAVMIEYLKTVGAVFSGIVGAILGYYFGKA